MNDWYPDKGPMKISVGKADEFHAAGCTVVKFAIPAAKKAIGPAPGPGSSERQMPPVINSPIMDYLEARQDNAISSPGALYAGRTRAAWEDQLWLLAVLDTARQNLVKSVVGFNTIRARPVDAPNWTRSARSSLYILTNCVDFLDAIGRAAGADEIASQAKASITGIVAVTEANLPTGHGTARSDATFLEFFRELDVHVVKLEWCLMEFTDRISTILGDGQV